MLPGFPGWSQGHMTMSHDCPQDGHRVTWLATGWSQGHMIMSHDFQTMSHDWTQDGCRVTWLVTEWSGHVNGHMVQHFAFLTCSSKFRWPKNNDWHWSFFAVMATWPDEVISDDKVTWQVRWLAGMIGSGRLRALFSDMIINTSVWWLAGRKWPHYSTASQIITATVWVNDHSSVSLWR